MLTLAMMTGVIKLYFEIQSEYQFSIEALRQALIILLKRFQKF